MILHKKENNRKYHVILTFRNKVYSRFSDAEFWDIEKYLEKLNCSNWCIG